MCSSVLVLLISLASSVSHVQRSQMSIHSTVIATAQFSTASRISVLHSKCCISVSLALLSSLVDSPDVAPCLTAPPLCRVPAGSLSLYLVSAPSFSFRIPKSTPGVPVTLRPNKSLPQARDSAACPDLISCSTLIQPAPVTITRRTRGDEPKQLTLIANPQCPDSE
ncbi:hypothetical protein C8R45DRAFT_163872 [Mycena sanguinolenta]|nr:hypothetical protein C8R45DRAFT_163872 [Mycena sanguinolenta]